MKTMLKSNRLQKKILAMSSAIEEEEPAEESIPSMESIDIRGLIMKAQQKEPLTALEAGILVANGFCPKCGTQLKKGSFVSRKDGETVALVESSILVL